MKNGMRPIHPGEILREEYLLPLKLGADVLMLEKGYPHSEILQVLKGKAPITPRMARRLGKILGTTPKFWMNLQAMFDLCTKQESAIELAKEVHSLRIRLEKAKERLGKAKEQLEILEKLPSAKRTRGNRRTPFYDSEGVSGAGSGKNQK
jgi:addiction module HigA family antidote